MQKITSAFAAALIVTISAAGGMMVMTSPAEAKIETKWEYTNKDKCYKVKKVPATVEYNTKGKLIREASRSWSGNMHKHGSKVVKKYNDPVYKTTRRVIEEQHMTLVPTSCH